MMNYENFLKSKKEFIGQILCSHGLVNGPIEEFYQEFPQKKSIYQADTSSRLTPNQQLAIFTLVFDYLDASVMLAFDFFNNHSYKQKVKGIRRAFEAHNSCCGDFNCPFMNRLLEIIYDKTSIIRNALVHNRVGITEEELEISSNNENLSITVPVESVKSLLFLMTALSNNLGSRNYFNLYEKSKLWLYVKNSSLDQTSDDLLAQKAEKEGLVELSKSYFRYRVNMNSKMYENFEELSTDILKSNPGQIDEFCQNVVYEFYFLNKEYLMPAEAIKLLIIEPINIENSLSLKKEDIDKWEVHDSEQNDES